MSSAETHPRRIVTAPPPTHPGLRAMVLDVECAENEEVVWLWTETAAGSVVSGYQLLPADQASTWRSSQRVAQLCGVS
jgi:hypothetical protein